MADPRFTNPFVGLRAFEEEEDFLFFGREQEIDDLIKKFSENRFLAVIGSSGSGKSSLVKSGMLPRIYGGFMKAGGNWRVALMQPGENPLGYLARQLAGDGVLYAHTENAEFPYEAVIESRLRRSENGLQQVYTDARLPAGENLLIVVDQFEELFRFSKYEKENKLGKSDAMHFIRILLTATRQSGFPIYVLLTMRSDFLGDCAEFRGLPETINQGQYLVPRMTRDEIREAVTGPVAVSGAAISQRLVTRLLNDINNDPDQLPILQHALMRTWDAWYQRGAYDEPIDFDDYDGIGTMKTALSQHADEAYGELTTEKERKICELLFKALTDTAADVRGIRRPRTITDLCLLAGASQTEIKKQVELFRKPGRTFLMPPPGVELTDETIIDISHESLMRIWLRLVSWTGEEARSGDLYLRLAGSAQLRERGQRGLLRDPELGLALKWKDTNRPGAKWAEGYKADFEQTMAYLEESRVADLAEKKMLARKEAIRKRLVRTIFVLLGSLVIAGGIIAMILNVRRQEAEDARNDALEQRNQALIATNEALRAKNAAIESNRRAELEKQRALNAEDTARMREQEAHTSEEEARRQRDSAELQRRSAEELRKQAIYNTYKNAPSEYARLIREGPVNKKEIQDERFDYKLAAYTAHLDLLGPKIEETHEPAALEQYRQLQDRLYYNNDLYEKIYACMEAVDDPVARKKLFEKDVPFRGAFNGEMDGSNPDFKAVAADLQSRGKRIYRITSDRQHDRVLCATDDNWVYIYHKGGDGVSLENRIPMGALVTALDYNRSNNVIYFGLKTGNIGYIRYNKDKRNQPVFENYLGSPVVAVQLFKTTVKGQTLNFLLAAAEKSRVVVYKLDDVLLQPDKKLFGNTLPEKDLGVLTNAQYDESLHRVLIKGRSQKSAASRYYSWNPFTALALDEYKNFRNDAAFLDQTNIYK